MFFPDSGSVAANQPRNSLIDMMRMRGLGAFGPNQPWDSDMDDDVWGPRSWIQARDIGVVRRQPPGNLGNDMRMIPIGPGYPYTDKIGPTSRPQRPPRFNPNGNLGNDIGVARSGRQPMFSAVGPTGYTAPGTGDKYQRAFQRQFGGGGPARNDIGVAAGGNSAYGYAQCPMQARNDIGVGGSLWDRRSRAPSGRTRVARNDPRAQPVFGGRLTPHPGPRQNPNRTISSNPPRQQPYQARNDIGYAQRPMQARNDIGVAGRGVSGSAGSLGEPRRQIRRDPRGTDIGYAPSGGSARREYY